MRPPLVPNTLTVYVPADPLHVNVEVPVELVAIMTLVGLTMQIRPLAGETTVNRLTAPANPKRLETTIVAGPPVCATTVTEEGFEVMLKSEME